VEVKRDIRRGRQETKISIIVALVPLTEKMNNRTNELVSITRVSLGVASL